MLMRLMGSGLGVLWVMIVLVVGTAEAAPNLTALEVMQRAADIDRGQDSVSRLTFTLASKEGREKRLVLAMAWKDFEGRKGFDSKIIMFNEFPPDTRDVGFMAWVYEEAANKEDDMWLYLPELRSVRKLVHQKKSSMHHHHDEASDEKFSASVLQREELDDRAIGLDTHHLMGLDTLSINGVLETVYVIESIPVDPHTAPYAKKVTWVSANNYLPLQRLYYNVGSQLVKKVDLTWQSINAADPKNPTKIVWVWKRLIAENMMTGDKTTLDHSDVQVNVGVKDKVFSKRVIKKGVGVLKRRFNL